MNEPFGQLIATLHKAQGTMAVQLDRLAQTRVPDKVRLPRLEREARHLRNATTALLERMMHKEASPNLIVDAKVLVALFENAEQRAASLLWRQKQVDGGRSDEPDDETIDEAEVTQGDEGPNRVEPANADRVRPKARSMTRNTRVAHQLSELGLSGTRSAQAKGLRRPRSSACRTLAGGSD